MVEAIAAASVGGFDILPICLECVLAGGGRRLRFVGVGVLQKNFDWAPLCGWKF